MKILEANISPKVADFLAERLKELADFELANQQLFAAFGIVSFFENDEELARLKKELLSSEGLVGELDRTEYGDFQTNTDLANQAVAYLTTKKIAPQVVIEPTCGKGNFILAVLQHFPEIEHILGVEIYAPYVWETKFRLIQFFLANHRTKKPQISIIQGNVFDFDFKRIANLYATKEILVIGNPPWVTNAKLGVLHSNNLPTKTNFKHHSGLDALTGKGNFDIAESITLMMLENFHVLKGHIFFLVKNSVIKNLVFDQKKHQYAISEIEKLGIDSKKEFKVTVEAAFFYARFNANPALTCKEINFYANDKSIGSRYGWAGDKFVANLDTYFHTQAIEGNCPFEWRQGVKHDCAAIMELKKVGEKYENGLGEEVVLEEGLVYGMLKSSDLKPTVISQTRKFTIVTQKKVGDSTDYLQAAYPNTYQYLKKHEALFAARKSSIYRNKPPFSIFGIGDYSFQPYKVAIAGLYKTFHFCLLLPQNGKPLLLDDTCYALGFDRLEYAAYTLILLNAEKNSQFLAAITFADAKRTFTKEVLMRIDISVLAKLYDKNYLSNALNQLNTTYQLKITLDAWASFLEEMQAKNVKQ